MKQTGCRVMMLTGAYAGRKIGETFPVVPAFAKIIDESGKHLLLMHRGLCTMMLIIQHNLSLYCQFISLYGIRTMVLTIERNEKGMSMGIPDCKWLGLETSGCHSMLMEPSVSSRLNGSQMMILHTHYHLWHQQGVINHWTICSSLFLTTKDNWSLGMETTTWFGPASSLNWKTLNATTQLVPSVEAETQDIIWHHFQTRLSQFKVRHINDTCFVDTLFSSVPLYEASPVCTYSHLNTQVWMRYTWCAVNPRALQLYRKWSPNVVPRWAKSLIMLRSSKVNGGCNTCKVWQSSPNILSPITWTKTTWLNGKETHTKPLVGFTFWQSLEHRFSTGWCFSLEYMCLLQTAALAQRSLVNWLTLHKLHWDERPGISVFLFSFWEAEWYYNPRQIFPNPKKLKGRFLGVAHPMTITCKRMLRSSTEIMVNMGWPWIPPRTILVTTRMLLNCQKP